jgi:RNA recognition motif-containing protein
MSDDNNNESSSASNPATAAPEAESKTDEAEEQKFSYDYDRSAEGRGYGDYGGRPSRQEEDLAGKLFLGGVSWQTTLEGLRFHFERIGELKDAHLMTDKRTGQSKGFGFVTFRDPAGINKQGPNINMHNRLLSVEVS